MVSKSELKLITSLRQKKYRDLEDSFVAEGPKIIEDFMSAHAVIKKLYCLAGYFEQVATRVEVDFKTLKKLSGLKTPNAAIAVFKKFETALLPKEGLILCLDEIQDPGNLGTIIRLADWYGVNHIVCSAHTVDCYNPKVVQATMGSLARVTISYVDLFTFINDTKLPIYGGFMSAPSVYKTNLSTNAMLVMGNEGNGISPQIEALINQKISIPNMGTGETESLNVASATAILLSEFKRSTEK